MTFSLDELRKKGTVLLSEATPDAGFDSEQLLYYCFGLNKTTFLLSRGGFADEEKSKLFFELVSRRAAGKPLQYILGDQAFLDRTYKVGEGVLIPRPETEQLAELCIEKINGKGCRTVYDLCAGSGCIGLSIARKCPDTQVFLIEKYGEALDYLIKNSEGINCSGVNVVEADIFDFDVSSLPRPDMIVSNPPYIPSDEISSLGKEVRFEPLTALDGGKDGLDFYRCIASRWLPAIKKGGCVFFECGEGQAEMIRSMIPDGYKTEVIDDFYGAKRFVYAEL